MSACRPGAPGGHRVGMQRVKGSPDQRIDSLAFIRFKQDMANQSQKCTGTTTVDGAGGREEMSTAAVTAPTICMTFVFQGAVATN